MLCKKCNRKLDINDRCCLYCGEVNPYNKKNIELETQKEVEEIKKTLEKEDNKNNKKTKQKQEIITKDIKYNKVVFVLINMISLLIISYFLNNKLDDITKSIIISLIIDFYLFCLENIFMKANQKWYFALIPIINIYYYFLISSSDDEHLIIKLFGYCISVNLLIWFVGIFGSFDIAIFLFLIFNIPIFKYFDYKLGQSFSFNKYISMLFPLIVIPIIAFNKKYQY